jgi:hypothetical protein
LGIKVSFSWFAKYIIANIIRNLANIPSDSPVENYRNYNLIATCIQPLDEAIRSKIRGDAVLFPIAIAGGIEAAAAGEFLRLVGRRALALAPAGGGFVQRTFRGG